MDPARLEALPLFASLSAPDRVLIAEHAEVVEVPDGKQVATAKEFGYSFFAIEEGTADVRIDDENVGRLGPGDFFGEIALLCTGRRTACVVATSPMTLFSLFEQDFRLIEAGIPVLARELRRAAGERLAAARA